MDPRTNLRPGALRSLTATLGLAWAAVALARLSAAAAPGAPAPDVVVGCLVLGLGSLAAAALAAGCGMLTVAALARTLGHSWTRTEAVAGRLVPVMLRRALAVGVGAGIAMGLGPTALADEVDVGWQVTTDVTTEAGTAPSAVVPGATPVSREQSETARLAAVTLTHAGHAAPGVGPSPATTASEPPTTLTTSVTVQPGDSLWTITAGLLPASATDADVAATWPLLYAANLDVVGADPDLIRPGDVLTVPAGISA